MKIKKLYEAKSLDIFEAIEKCDYDYFISKINSGIDVNIRDEYELTPLMTIANIWESSLPNLTKSIKKLVLKEMMIILIKEGADLNVRDNFNRDFVHLFAHKYQKEIIEYLRERVPKICKEYLKEYDLQNAVNKYNL